MKAKKRMQFETAFNSYVVTKTIGQGGSGKVYHVQDESGQEYALKYLDCQLSTEKVKRFKNELFFCLKQTHKNIVKAVDWGFRDEGAEKRLFYVMDYYPSTLRKLIEEGVLHKKILCYFSQILDGVEDAHFHKIWHRDIKPENILYDPASNTLVIADWGIAHFSEAHLHTMVITDPQERLANFRYAAPEQRVKGQKVDHRADIYALGLILNEMFTQTVPQGTGYRTIAKATPEYEYLDRLVEGMIRHSPEERPNSIDEVKCQLIAYGNECVSRQKLSELKNRVIPSSEPDDPLIHDPLRIVDVDYQPDTNGLGKLAFKFNQRFDSLWLKLFKSSSVPEDTSAYNTNFDEDGVSVEVYTHQVQPTVDSLKRILEHTNRKYRETRIQQQQQREKAKREELEMAIERERIRQSVLKDIKF